jgi:hypothetical protein
MGELKDYLAPPYTVILRRDHEGDFVAKVDELPRVLDAWEHPRRSARQSRRSKEPLDRRLLMNGNTVPVPADEEPLPSGKWLQRVPRKLHRKLQLLCRE